MRYRRYIALGVTVLLLTFATSAFAQQGKGNECTPAGVWYGGSVVAYHMTVIPAGPAGHYTVFAEGMYKDGVMTTAYWGTFTKKNHKYEGSLMQLYTADPDFLNMPPIGKMPDIRAGWSSMEMLDCNTIKNTLPFFGLYFASNIWQPGVLWNLHGKIPMEDVPDVDLLDVLNAGKPIVETYHRLSTEVNPALLHNN
jgi:hypothetical protein